jgi:NADPH:quinone reductase-like Zn-dependent oxidoreductase
VCGPNSVELVESLGAERVLDYTNVDYTTTADTYDVVFDAAMKTSFSEAKTVLARGGTYLTLDWPIHEVLRGALDRDAKVMIGTARKNPDDLDFLTKLLEDGAIRPVIDRCYPLEQTAEAHRYVDAGHKQGNVVIDVGDEDDSRSDTAAARVDETLHRPPNP